MSANTTTLRGTVKSWNDAKGFGFIVPTDKSKDVFVHVSAIAGEGVKTLAQGVPVEYEVKRGRRGPQAVNVRALPMRRGGRVADVDQTARRFS